MFGGFALREYLDDTRVQPRKEGGSAHCYYLTRLRYLSFASDMATVMDSLILRRCRERLHTFWAPSQSGGVYDALTSIVMVVLLSKLRLQAGLPLILAFIDFTCAFDTADQNLMRKKAYDAGIGGRIWLRLRPKCRAENSQEAGIIPHIVAAEDHSS